MRSAAQLSEPVPGRGARGFPSMSSLTEKDRPIVQLLLNAGTCPRCILRFCCVGSQTLYRHPDEDLMKDLQDFLRKTGGEEGTVCLDGVDPPCKRIRLEGTAEGPEDPNRNGALAQIPAVTGGNAAVESSAGRVCNVCLGVLQEFCEPDFVKKVCQKVNSADYQFTSFVFSVSLPPQLSVRESVFTRMAVMKALEKIKEEDFLKHFPCPPSSPKNLCDALDIQCNNGAVFVADQELNFLSHSPFFHFLEGELSSEKLPVLGRYNKYSRNLPQTPWIIDGERKLESSVEELISEHLMAEFKADSFNFSSSGREDVDVRTLGNGRPFAIELVNPRRIRFTAEEMKRLQQAINNSSDKIQVRDLQLVTREAIGRMKEGEEEKTKTYSALIWTDRAIQREDIALLDDIKELKLDQKTPLRVLHRRPLAVRCRVIHTMSSEYIDEHHFCLHLKTQAGTVSSYVKEFVHGDFGRTKPNIGSLLNRTADILELDVESVDVDWPPTLDN
ncbi:putative tRNA pseudouridine synthase Pus10 [Pitangus sulphuratus]|nr:putative tRNA pseudouridine synthase Pus10 [Pitangus sulphuratus]